MVRNIVIFLFMLMPAITGFNHPFYVSVIEAEYKAAQKELEVSCKIYPDDLEATLKQFVKHPIDLSAENKTENNKIIESYFKKHLGFKINGITKPFQFLGYENDKEATWIYLSIPALTNVKSVEVSTDMMYEYKEEQTNIVHITINGKRKSFKLNSPNKVALASN